MGVAEAQRTREGVLRLQNFLQLLQEIRPPRLRGRELVVPCGPWTKPGLDQPQARDAVAEGFNVIINRHSLDDPGIDRLPVAVVGDRSLGIAPAKCVYGSQAEMIEPPPSITGSQEMKYSPPTRWSTRAMGANHFTICSGSVMARKTSSGVAFMSMIVSCDLLISLLVYSKMFADSLLDSSNFNAGYDAAIRRNLRPPSACSS